MSETMTFTPPAFLEGIIALHGAMLRDAERLPRAIDAVTTAEGARALQLWFAKYAREVEHHHLREDDVVWPMLVEREAAFADSLEVLDADHHGLDAAMEHTRAALARLVDDVSTRPDAIAAAEALRQLLADHLEREEAVMFPALAHVFTEESFAALENALFKATPKRLIAFELPFAFDGQPDDVVADTLAGLPAVIRLLNRWFWQPSYDRLVAPLAAVST